MTNIDQFESVFKSADKAVYTLEEIEIRKVLVVTDLEEKEAHAFGDRVRAFLKVIPDPKVQWIEIPGTAFQSVGDLLDLASREAPDLICTYRNLHSSAWKWPYTLGSHVTALTQVPPAPVLILPRPDVEHILGDTNSVMAITDHLTGDHRLVNFGVRFTEKGGTLFLAHVEDGAQFERTMEVISKIPELDTETAREEILKQLLKEPKDYIRSCRDVLQKVYSGIQVEKIVKMGKRLGEYKGLIQEHKVDLLVMHARDEDQMAMHGLAYPLAVELRTTPILMI